MNIDIVRVWKDAMYHTHLSDEKTILASQNLAGFVELGDDELNTVVGGTTRTVDDMMDTIGGDITNILLTYTVNIIHATSSSLSKS